jgi:hypothetical protein
MNERRSACFRLILRRKKYIIPSIITTDDSPIIVRVRYECMKRGSTNQR